MIGCQSAGKRCALRVSYVLNCDLAESSLVEAVSGVSNFAYYVVQILIFVKIRVPRAAGTCTRCVQHVFLYLNNPLNPNYRCPMEVNLKNSAGSWSCQITLHFEYDQHGEPLAEVLRVPFGVVLESSDDVVIALMASPSSGSQLSEYSSRGLPGKIRARARGVPNCKGVFEGDAEILKKKKCCLRGCL